jgi:hypothetical protein
MDRGCTSTAAAPRCWCNGSTRTPSGEGSPFQHHLRDTDLVPVSDLVTNTGQLTRRPASWAMPRNPCPEAHSVAQTNRNEIHHTALFLASEASSLCFGWTLSVNRGRRG